MSQNVGPAGIGVCGAFMSPWRGAEGESLAAVPSSWLFVVTREL